ncbi:MAG: glycosyltransferase family 39 protein [Chloroflexota bacterium]|nr:glycosyltransferase family 39 protein [Chloroflexota bacterium]
MSPVETSQNLTSSDNHTQKEHVHNPGNRLATALFFLGLAVYLLTRLIHIPDFPIYFFTDEAIQTQQAADLIERSFRSAEGVLLPTYFENGGQYNLSLSVYTQVLPTLLFGKSIWITRGVSVLLSLAAPICIGLILKNVFHSRFWWLGPLLLSITPAWFLHSRTAFETVLMVSMYAAFLCFYMMYRQGKQYGLWLALLFGTLAFYAYSPGQVIMVTTGLLLLIADARYHWQHRKIALVGLAMLILLILPYLRFILSQEQAPLHHLTVLNSYWIKPIPVYEKIITYIVRYLKGLNPIFWFWPNPSIVEKWWPNLKLPVWMFSNQLDLARHTMKGYGHILWIVFPFWMIGLVQCVRGFKKPTHRTLLLVSLAAPTGAAIVDWGITRGMVFIIPAIIMIGLGFERFIIWLQARWKKLSFTHIALVSLLCFSAFSFLMLFDALQNGPTWYRDYGMAGMQYGSQQVFTRSAEIARAEPKTTVLVSSTWANGPNILLRYFADDLPNVRMGNINAFASQYRSLDRTLLFVMTGEDLTYINDSEKFTNVTIEETLPYPDGSDGFYFVRLEYVEGIEEFLAAERATRQALLTEVIPIQDQQVEVEYPTLDMNDITHIFDGDPTTLIRTLEANPLRLILTFPAPTSVNKITLVIGGTPTRVTVKAFSGGMKPVTLTDQVDSAIVKRNMQLEFSQTLLVDKLEVEILNIHDGEIAHVHLWEVMIE